MAGSDACQGRLLAELDVLHDLQRKGEITEQTVDAEEADDAEVTEQLVEWPSAVLANNLTDCTSSGNIAHAVEVLLTQSPRHSCPPGVQRDAR